jgi:hypothetical protein
VTEIHALFDWAAHTKRGMLLFIDEAVRRLAAQLPCIRCLQP